MLSKVLLFHRTKQKRDTKMPLRKRGSVRAPGVPKCSAASSLPALRVRLAMLKVSSDTGQMCVAMHLPHPNPPTLFPGLTSDLLIHYRPVSEGMAPAHPGYQASSSLAEPLSLWCSRSCNQREDSLY